MPAPARLRFRRVIVCALSLAAAAVPLPADTNQALLELLQALTRNGAITAEQSAAIVRLATAPAATAAAPSAAARLPRATGEEQPLPATVFASPREKPISRLAISGMLHPQWDFLRSSPSTGPAPAARNTFVMRRLKLGATGEISPDWSALIEADFAATNVLEQAYVNYRGFAGTDLIFGHTKVPFLREELLSDALIKGVERSAAHRVWIEQSGRGFGAKNTGLQLRRRWANGLNFAAAVTNTGAKNSSGTAGNVANRLAWYGQAGFGQPVGAGRLESAIQVGYLPDLLAAGPITAVAGHVLYEGPSVSLLAESASGWYATPTGAVRQTSWMIEPALKLTAAAEFVVRFAAVASGRLGLSPGALLRGAPATGDFERMDSFYVGGNYYFVGNTVRLAFGYEYARASDRLSGPAAENLIRGFRSRFQFLY